MPQITVFCGIRITMYSSSHNPPCFQAEYAGNKALVDVLSGCILKGFLPAGQMQAVLAWNERHRDMLMQGREADPFAEKDTQEACEACFPTVVQAIPGRERTVYAYFSDGAIRLYDVAPLIEAGGVFRKLADEAFFKDAMTVLNGTVAWDVSGHFDPAGCIDIDPLTLYAAVPAADPLSEA